MGRRQIPVGMVAFVFPGQNSHYVGMGADLWESEPAARAVLEEADDVLGLKLSTLMFKGPEDDLTRTENQQPAIVAHSAACLAVLDGRGIRPEMVAGHSLGEYSALIAAGVLARAEVIRLVRRRGELMAGAGGGAMAAVLGLDGEAVEGICEQAREVGLVIVANHNCPGQVVISGEPEAVKRASELATGAGAKRVVPLRVTGAFHSPMMQKAAEAQQRLLKELRFADATVPLVSNVDAVARRDAEGICDSLARQMVSPVRWEGSVRLMVERGVTDFVEVGPGAVLSGLVRRIAPEVATHSAGKAAEVAALTL